MATFCIAMVKFQQIIEGLSLKPKFGFFGYSSVILIRDNKESILFDTGGYGVRNALKNLLRGTVINKVFLSHLHFDHCANICLFPNADIYVHHEELDLLYKNLYYEQQDIGDFVKIALEKSRVISFSGNKKISNNTKIICTPGHTVGHSSLEVLSQEKKTILAGDAIETYIEYLDENCNKECFDKNAYVSSKKQLKDNFPIIIPGHSSVIKDGILQIPNQPVTYF